MDEFDEIIDNGLFAADDIMKTIKLALTASTTHEKDKLIHQIKKLYAIENNSMDAVLANNEEKAKVLDKLQQKVDVITSQYNTFDTNTSFIHELARNPPNSKSELIESIHEIEQAILQIKPLASPKALAQVSQLSPEKDLFELKTRDLLFSRLEELTYALKKRILVVEDSTNSSIAVVEKYGNVSGLINYHNELLEENEILKSEESKFIKDAMSKRRNMNSISPSLLSNISTVMQTELTELMNYGTNLNKSADFNGQFQPFDNVCNIPKSIQYNKADFGTNIDPDLVNKISEQSNPPELLNLMRNIIQQQNATIEKLLSELSPLRAINYSSIPEPSERLQKLWSTNDKFSSQIHELSDQIEKTNEDVRRLNYTIKRLIKQRGYYDELFCDIQKKLVPLTDETIALMKVNDKNKTIFNSLTDICYNFALSLLNIDSENFSSMKELLLSRIPPPPPVHKVVEPPPPPPQPEETETSSHHLDDPRKFFMIKPTMPKKPSKPRRTLTPADTSQASLLSLVKDVEKKPQLSIIGSNRVQIIDYIALMHDVAQTVEMKEPMFHADLNNSLRQVLAKITDIMNEAKENHQREIMTRVSQVAQSAHGILCRPKQDIGTTIDTCPTTEIEIQTEPPPDPKAKGKKPAKKK
ncbi:hypothetical protein TVAG_495600 [Trichomonas vaginalis G3]|uniref:Uncharacterized protein n=1 Tax=Trichomonas vaginalis (strain ATCC PRA-98 / G3) TaxID=412133 RepID=A2DVK2_TRIV3|nr:hypothetical protein TVAGG3_0275670 [Trichomonas vaginalis G3]EAY15544.1 hypothetical protein TVAG_495600 [Trichomonas vaginalis G3]KAI5526190.1 hypothetical protein TVAGG3_0275670 [Trichomonas vaginalis G3]|eukprot:XP_001327767.1 hypothetical protein [Trichomonas vaginalis G3]